MRAVWLAALAACAHSSAHRTPAPQPPPRVAPHVARTATVAALSPDAVLATIRNDYLGGVRRCYAHELKRARRTTRITVSFTVAADGRAQEGATAGNAPMLDACVTSLIARWQFPRPRDPSAFRLVLRLEPE